MHPLQFHTHTFLKFSGRTASLFPLILLVFFIGASCAEDSRFDCLKSSGKQTAIEVNLQGFHTLMLHDNITLTVYPDSQGKSSLEGGANLLEKISFTLVDSALIVRNENRCNWVRQLDREIHLHLHSSELRNIQHSSTGNIYFADTLVQNEFIMEIWNGHGKLQPLIRAQRGVFKIHSGVATIIPAGRVNRLDVYVASFGQFNGLELKSNEALIYHNSAVDLYLQVSNLLSTHLMSQGNVYYHGNATVEILEKQGKGKVFRIP